MSAASSRLPSWPALELGPHPLPARLSYERGIWGKVHGAVTDFRWIATTPAFALPGRRDELPHDLRLGTEDAPRPCSHWRTIGTLHYAVSCYRSRATDAVGRTGFLEKQVLEWRRPTEVPAALGALLLVPLVAGFDDGVWWGRQSGPQWSEDEDSTLSLAPTDAAAPLAVDENAVEAAMADGLAGLAEAVSETALAELYGALLAGQRAIPLRGLQTPLAPASLAALLLPLPRPLADELSIAGWLPSLRADFDDLHHSWHLLLGGAAALPSHPQPAPTAAQARQAEQMARAVLAGDPSRLGTAAAKSTGKAITPGAPAIELAMWGPSSAGKTALLAKLYIDGDGDWEVFPTASSLKFIQDMQRMMRTENGFPPATAVGGTPEQVEYLFRHKSTGVTASLRMEDRAGADSETLSEAIMTALGKAAGLVLLVDPLSEMATLEGRVWRTVQQVHIASGRGTLKDDRPIAVCVSKADVLIETPEDLRRAREDPDGFVRDHDEVGLIRALERFCNNYRLFPVSSAGVRLRWGAIEPVVFYDERLAPRLRPGGELLNLMAPFNWLLEQLTVNR